MKVTVELISRNVKQTNTNTTGYFDTEIQEDGERFLDLIDKAVGLPDEDFIRISIWRTEDAESNRNSSSQ